MRAAIAGLAALALWAAPASAVPVRAGDVSVAGIARGSNGVVPRVDPVASSRANDASGSGRGAGAAARAGERQHARTARKPRCLWRKRECYPPAKLWYRITVEFDGQLTLRFRRGIRGLQTCAPCWVRTTRVKWRIVSNTAMRLTLMCADEKDRAEPFLVRRRINGKRRPVGGCARGARRDLRPTLRFAAHGQGDVTHWTSTAVVEPVDGQVMSCEGFTHTMTAPGQAVAGAIRTAGGSFAGLQIDVTPVGSVMPPSGAAVTHTCTNKITGEVTTRRGSPAGGGACCHLWGSTGWYQRDDALGWRPITQKLRFSPRAANFGRRYGPQLEATHREITESTVEPVPPPGAALLLEEQSYGYKLVLKPCPNQGLDVERC
jgi:hypothetical protein